MSRGSLNVSDLWQSKTAPGNPAVGLVIEKKFTIEEGETLPRTEANRIITPRNNPNVEIVLQRKTDDEVRIIKLRK